MATGVVEECAADVFGLRGRTTWRDGKAAGPPLPGPGNGSVVKKNENPGKTPEMDQDKRARHVRPSKRRLAMLLPYHHAVQWT